MQTTSGTERSAAWFEASQARVLEWGAAHRRDLPWRRTRDPWAVLVSEVMLQQTQVARVAPIYERFLVQFPTPRRCASAGAAAVQRAWSGLGYNRRATSLHGAAQTIVDRHHGKVPSDLASLTALPGIGAYTARAVRAFAFEFDTGVVDTNVARVLARAVAGRPLTMGETQAVADRFVPIGDAWRFNQAMLDLGSLCCRATNPLCAQCPLRTRCRYRRGGGADPARTTAGTARPQARFEGSDRQVRGRLVSALRDGPVEWRLLARAAQLDGDRPRAERLAQGLIADGIAQRVGQRLALA